MPVVKKSVTHQRNFASNLVILAHLLSWLVPFVPVSTIAKSTSYFPQSQIEVPFYRSPNSQFPSGMLSLERLEKNTEPISNITPAEIFLIHNGKRFPQGTNTFLTAQDLKNPHHTGDSKRDLGLIQILVETHLLKYPNRFAKKILKLVPGQKLKPEILDSPFKNGYVKIRLGHAVGYVDLAHTISKFDFAIWIYPKGADASSTNQGWEQVEARVFDEMKTMNKRMISLNEIEGIWTDSTRAIATSNSEHIPMWSILKIENSESVVWRSSKVSGHGIVWWKEVRPKLGTDQTTRLHIDQLLQRKIASVSFHPKNPKKAIISANGVYKTADGVYWERLSQFDGYSGPVYYYNDLLIFVGHYRSTDGGRTFEPYIKIPELTKTIADFTGAQPPRLELKSIKTKGALRLVLGVDIGSKELQIQSPLYTQNWSIVADTKKR